VLEVGGSSTGSTLQGSLFELLYTGKVRRQDRGRNSRCGARNVELSGRMRLSQSFPWRRIDGREPADYLRAIETAAAASNGALTDFRGAFLEPIGVADQHHATAISED
jgi:hypothetical protein